MKKFESWLLTLPQSYQLMAVLVLSPLLFGFIEKTSNTILTEISHVVVAKITKQIPVTINMEHGNITQPENLEFKAIYSVITECLKQIDNEPDVTEKRRLLDHVLKLLEKAMEIGMDNAETNYLYGEAYLRTHEYQKAISYYNTALKQQYLNKSDVLYGYGYAYNGLGDQYIANNELSKANEYYNHSIDNMNQAISEDNFLHRTIDEAKNQLSRTESRKVVYNNAEKLFISYSSISRNSNNISKMRELAADFSELKLWRNTLRSYYWLYKQDVSDQSRSGIIRDFQYRSDFWEFSDDFEHDISFNLVNGIISGDYVNFRHEPNLGDNIIGQLRLYDEVKILQRSSFRQVIGNVRAYWYKISTNDGIEGWAYGKYLFFYPGVSPNNW